MHFGFHRFQRGAKSADALRRVFVAAMRIEPGFDIGQWQQFRDGCGTQAAQDTVACAHDFTPVVRRHKKLARCSPGSDGVAQPAVSSCLAARPVMLSRQPQSALTTRSAPVSLMAATLSVTMASEISA